MHGAVSAILGDGDSSDADADAAGGGSLSENAEAVVPAACS
jgi:hypothetical protein